MKKKLFFSLLVLIVVLLAAIFLGRSIFRKDVHPYRRPGDNVIMISLDALRTDHVGVYGYERNTTPHIDALAQKGIVFERAYSNTTWTLPSHMSLMTSLYPSVHRVFDTDSKLPSSMRTLAEELKDNGYLNVAFTGGGFTSKVFGFDRGFDLYREKYDAKTENFGEGWRLSHILEDGFRWLEENADQKFFMFLHCFDTHEPFIAHSYLAEFDKDYDGPLKFLHNHAEFMKHFDREKYQKYISRPLNINVFYEDIINHQRIDLTDEDKDHIIALYDNEVKFVDHHFGRLTAKLEELDLLDKTIVIILADHGEELLERGRIQHSLSVYEEIIHIPLIVHIPRYTGAGRNSALVQMTDIAPTLLDILDIEPPKAFKGISVLNPKHPPNPYIVAEQKQMVTIRAERYKLMVNRKTQEPWLFDLEVDPAERINVAESHPKIVKDLKKKLFDTLNIAELDEKTKEKLRSLGYLK